MPKKPIRKPCLKCGKKFETENRFNRICPACAKRNVQAGGGPNLASAGPGRRRGRGSEGRGEP